MMVSTWLCRLGDASFSFPNLKIKAMGFLLPALLFQFCWINSTSELPTLGTSSGAAKQLTCSPQRCSYVFFVNQFFKLFLSEGSVKSQSLGWWSPMEHLQRTSPLAVLKKSLVFLGIQIQSWSMLQIHSHNWKAEWLFCLKNQIVF